ncbi:DUF2249 domain-containing protein [Alicyclobacillus sp. SO9]|uniref:DUF2249 domain-containing protein n=1 Tax=Alicyclobacillus sp. SO9 TaxID=2665646 RepID=UPI0018E77A2B|nr:DUF2249 domain-containing protein [Alicyclobacillus sp. SO9]QQE80999.1 DUF2249 domain-containing protein [Alicyclobacillus sp. SO9]
MSQQIVDLDVRDILRKKEEPFPVIMEGINKLGEEEILQLHATFEPTPLLRVLKKKGYDSIVRKMEDEADHFVVQFYREKGGDNSLPYWHIDNRGLEPPEPMMRALELLDNESGLAEGVWGLEIWNERVPAILLPELDERGFAYDVDDKGNGTVVVRMHA